MAQHPGPNLHWTVDDLVPARAQTPRPRLATVQFAGQSGHPFVFSGGGTTGSNNDTADYVLGDRSVRVTSGGGGVQAKIAGTFTTALDLTGRSLVLWVKQTGLSNFLGGYPRIYVGDTALTNAYYWKLQESAGQPYALDGEWMKVTLPFGTATAVGVPSRASLAALTIQVYDDNTGNPVSLAFGGLATTPEPADLANGVVSVAFDDGFLSQFTTARPYMDKYGFPGTAFIITETLWNNSAYTSYFNIDQAYQLQDQSGWDLATHAYTALNHNLSYTGISDDAAARDMAQAKAYMTTQGFKAADILAYPSGNYNSNTLAAAQRLFSAARSISSIGNVPDETFPPADSYRLRSIPCGPSTSVATITAAVDRAFANKEWLILTFHDIQTTATGGLQYSTANFQSVMDYLNTKGIPVRTISDVLRQTRPS